MVHFTFECDDIYSLNSLLLKPHCIYIFTTHSLCLYLYRLVLCLVSLSLSPCKDTGIVPFLCTPLMISLLIAVRIPKGEDWKLCKSVNKSCLPKKAWGAFWSFWLCAALVAPWAHPDFWCVLYNSLQYPQEHSELWDLTQAKSKWAYLILAQTGT